VTLAISAEQTWQAIVARVKLENPMVGSFLADVAPLERVDGGIVLVFPPEAGFSLKKVANNVSLIKDAVRFVTGSDLPVLLLQAHG
jgi:hypothetical protein